MTGTVRLHSVKTIIIYTLYVYRSSFQIDFENKTVAHVSHRTNDYNRVDRYIDRDDRRTRIST